jgi:hypothetical protein
MVTVSTSKAQEQPAPNLGIVETYLDRPIAPALAAALGQRISLYRRLLCPSSAVTP